MDVVMVFLTLFFAYIAAFSYFTYKIYQRNVWRERWVEVGCVIWGMLGFLMFLTGFLFGNIVSAVIGVAVAFANASFLLTYYIKSERKVKKFIEVIFGVISLGIIIYGYVITGSLILEIATLFVAVMILIAFTLSYLLPRIHDKVKNVKE